LCDGRREEVKRAIKGTVRGTSSDLARYSTNSGKNGNFYRLLRSCNISTYTCARIKVNNVCVKIIRA
jgi:hypothetical protein